MSPGDDYLLNPAKCTDEANYMCMKLLCPSGLKWYDMKRCVKIMDTPSTKDEALAKCREIHAGANLFTVKSNYEQNVMEQFLLRAGVTDEVFLGATKLENGHWFWDDGNPIFTTGI